MLATFVYISLVSRLTNEVWLAVVFQVGLCSFLRLSLHRHSTAVRLCAHEPFRWEYNSRLYLLLW